MKIAHDDVGSGEAILFIHGFPHNRKLWSGQLAALGEHARCIAPDLRGFGATKGAAPYSMDQYADDMAELLTSLGVKTAMVVGLSMGGYIALALWRRHPHLIRSLVLADTRAGADSEEGRRKRDEMIALARAGGSGAVADAQISGMLGKSTRENSPEIVTAVHAMLASAPVEGVVGALQALRDRPDSLTLLETIHVPVLIIVGDEDVLTPLKESQIMHEKIAGSVLEVVHGSGHLSNVEKPAAFNQLVAGFLTRLKGE